MGAPLCYFAHPANIHDTQLERHLVAAAYRYFDGGISLVNPSDRAHRAMALAIKSSHPDKNMGSKKVREYFLDLAGSCQFGIGLPFRCGAFGADVYAQLEHIANKGYALWSISPKGILAPIYDIDAVRKLSADETRALVYKAGGSFRSY